MPQERLITEGAYQTFSRRLVIDKFILSFEKFNKVLKSRGIESNKSLKIF
tara:strand:+ start:371 stop:520 length:150 start_codon:yes stop_codon:yes gene_type:complete